MTRTSTTRRRRCRACIQFRQSAGTFYFTLKKTHILTVVFVSFFTSFLPLFFYKYLFLSSFWVVVIDTVGCSRSGSSNESDNFYFLDRNFGKRKLLRGIDTIRPVQLVPFGRWG